MNNIQYKGSIAATITPSMIESCVNIRDEIAAQMSEHLVRDIDARAMVLIKRRLGVNKVDLEELNGRLARVITRGTGYVTLLLDGRPFARVYDITVEKEWFTTTVSQVIEEIEG